MGRGDFLPGYYRGDPGIFGALGGILQKAVGFIPGVGPIASAALGAVTGTARASGISTPQLLAASAHGTFAPEYIKAYQAHNLAAATPVTGKLPMMKPPGTAMVPYGGAHLGRVMRPSGKGYFTKRHLAALARGLTRARPRMNPFNPSALRRAARRAHAFIRMSRRLIGYYSPRRPKGRAFIKAGRKKR